MKYKINEIFQSIQGEGTATGKNVIFIRFAGCNQKCKFCDTDFKDYVFMTEQKIVLEVKKYTSDTIVLTGGEPMLQLTQELINALSGYKLHIETNGTIDIFFSGIKHISVSPKDYMNWNQKDGTDLKILIDLSEIDLDYIYADTNFDNYILQPIDNGDYLLHLDRAIKLVKKYPDWRLGVQLHKLINVQ